MLTALDNVKSKLTDSWENTKALMDVSSIGKVTGSVVGVLLGISSILGFIWDTEPGLFSVTEVTRQTIASTNARNVTGTATVSTLIQLTDVMLHKRGGYLTNDISPPGVWMDNIPNWEFGVLVQIRDMTRTLRNNLSRSQSQSTEDPDLVRAENQFYFDNDKWALPETENRYQNGIIALQDYLDRLGSPEHMNAQFYARADNLRTWLAEVETRLGSLSQRLSASVGKRQLDLSLAGDAAATQSTASDRIREVKTPWAQLDDVFYEARGTTWALIHLLSAIEIDFKEVLEKKNALVSLQQIIRELEPTQDTLWSPVILNGSGLGIMANHSLVMGSHVSRANAAIIDLRNLLEQG